MCLVVHEVEMPLNVVCTVTITIPYVNNDLTSFVDTVIAKCELIQRYLPFAKEMRDKENQFSPRAYWTTFFNNSIILKQISNTVCDPTGKKKPFNIHPPAFTFSLPETVACFAACKSPNK